MLNCVDTSLIEYSPSDLFHVIHILPPRCSIPTQIHHAASEACTLKETVRFEAYNAESNSKLAAIVYPKATVPNRKAL